VVNCCSAEAKPRGQVFFPKLERARLLAAHICQAVYAEQSSAELRSYNRRLSGFVFAERAGNCYQHKGPTQVYAVMNTTFVNSRIATWVFGEFDGAPRA